MVDTTRGARLGGLRETRETRNTSYPDAAIIALLIELRTKVDAEAHRLQALEKSASETVRHAIRALANAARAGLGADARVSAEQAALNDISRTLAELVKAADVAGRSTYALIAQRIAAELGSLAEEGRVPGHTLDVLLEWLRLSIDYFNPDAQDHDQRTAALVHSLGDARWTQPTGPAEQDGFMQGLMTKSNP